MKAINIGLLAYQKLGKTRHQFREDSIYSLFQVSELSGLSPTGVRYRAITDRWPTLKVYRRGNVRKGRYVEGSFLRDLQLKAKGGH